MNHRQLFSEHIAQTSDAPLALEITHADGCKLYAADGKIYLDLISGIAVSNLGHNNPLIKTAIKDQVDKYLHLMVYGELIESPQTSLAKYLTDLLPEKLSSVYYTNSGSEAVEGAVKLAKRYTGRTEIISFENSYHGSTMGSLSLGNNEERKNAFRPLIPDNRILKFNDHSQLQSITHKTAAVIMEPVQAEAGIIKPDAAYLTAIETRCNETGALFILDECQTGFGRTGKLFAFEKYSVTPDVLITGKAFGGGLPLGAFISSKEIMSSLIRNPVLGHLTTFGGHPVCCASALAALDILTNKNEAGLTIYDSVIEKAELFQHLLQHPAIVACRAEGLLIAIEFSSAAFTFALNEKLIGRGLLTDWFLFAPNCLRIAPPLIISEEEIRFACGIILETLHSFN